MMIEPPLEAVAVALARAMETLRKARGLTQEQVALAARMARTQYSDLAGAKRDTRFLTVRTVLIGLDVEWTGFGRTLERIDPLPMRYATSTRRLRDMPRPERPKRPYDDGLVGVAIVVRSFREGLCLGAQEAFAYRNGFDRGLVGNVERAERTIGFNMVRRFAVALGLTWVEFFDALDVVDRLADARTRTGKRK
jgi:transcriptional regulator with XRE-family HTH domain